MNILTFDIEEWYIEKAYFGAKVSKYIAYDRLLDQMLQKLDKTGVKGTFFCVGKLAADFPKVVRKIADAGHEIGCHSNTHQWLNKMTMEQAMDDTHSAVDALQQCIGQKVISYRAPAFSIGCDNKWAFEVLASNGITCDASVFPASRDFGGFPEFAKVEPTVVKYNGIEMHEFPIVTTKLLGKQLAYSGGGYFRFFPYRFVEKEMKQSRYSMAYFHLADLLPVVDGVMTKREYEGYFNEPGTIKTRYFRYLKSNFGVGSNKKKLFKLFDSLVFCDVATADRQIDWTNAPIVQL